MAEARECMQTYYESDVAREFEARGLTESAQAAQVKASSSACGRRANLSTWRPQSRRKSGGSAPARSDIGKVSPANARHTHATPLSPPVSGRRGCWKRARQVCGAWQVAGNIVHAPMDPLRSRFTTAIARRQRVADGALAQLSGPRAACAALE